MMKFYLDFNNDFSFRFLLVFLLLVMSCKMSGHEVKNLEDLKGTYGLTDSIQIKIQSIGEDWFLQIGDNDKKKIVETDSHSWKVPELDIEFYGEQHDGYPELFVKRYGETVSLSPTGHATSGIYKDMAIPEVVEDLTPRLMVAWNVPGVSVAVIRNNRVAWLGQYGIKTHGQAGQVGPETVFEAASMSKPAFAYVVLQLIEDGIMELDIPLVEYLGEPYIKDEPLHKKITARMVMSHTSGFPNWHDGPDIPVLFEPGTEYKYSGEGFLFLQRVVEKLTGLGAEELMQKRLLEPLGMTTSSYVWQASYDSQAAGGHNRQGRIKQKDRSIYRRANMAYTLYTTPADYSKFLLEMMKEDRSVPHSLSLTMLDEMMSIQSDASGREPMVRRGGESGRAVHFGLGWRIEALESGMRYLHTGSNGTGFRCISEFNPETGNGIVIMTNGVGGARLRTDLIRYTGER